MIANEYVYAKLRHLFNAFDISLAIPKISPIFFNAPKRVSTALVLVAASSGVTIGGANWIIRYGSVEIAFVSTWSSIGHRYARLLDLNGLFGNNLLITTINSATDKKKPTVYNKLFIDHFKEIENTLKKCGNLLFPTSSIDDLFLLVEQLNYVLESASIKKPIHILSRTAKQSILQASIFSEWYFRIFLRKDEPGTTRICNECQTTPAS